MAPWIIPRELTGRTVAVLGCGKTMSAAVVESLRVAGVAMIAVNRSYELAPDAWALYAADAMWWQQTPEARHFAGHRVSCEMVPGVRRLHNAGSEGWSEDRDCVHTYGNSGAQAIQVAVKAGAARVLLCGMDMRGGHWHPEHVEPLRQTPRSTYERWVIQMGALARYMRGRAEIINCTPGSAIAAFPFASLRDALLPEVTHGRSADGRE